MEGEEGAVELVPATRRQRALAGLLDMAVAGAVVRLMWDRRAEGDGASRGGPLGRLAVLAPLRAIVEEQVGSPGAWVAGIRTVDRRTGRRVVLWRTAMLVGVRAASQLVASRLQSDPPETMSELEWRQRKREIEEIEERYAADPDGRNRAMADYFEAHPQPWAMNVARPIAIAMGTTLVNSRLRRRLAPTMLVKRRG